MTVSSIRVKRLEKTYSNETDQPAVLFDRRILDGLAIVQS
jgi:hypothetical protein